MSAAQPKGRAPGRRPPRAFLTARWTDVVLASYRVPPELLLPHVPEGSELDTPDGAPDLHLLSVVALRFQATRVRGIRIPTAQDFPEVNLRFYVRRGNRRASVFLREFVPRPLVILGARLFYRQPYFRAAIRHEINVDEGTISVHTRFATRGHAGEINLRALNQPMTPPSDSEAHFLKEHYWGFDRMRGRSFRYRVEHPVWRCFPVEAAHVTINPGAILGGQWRDVPWEKPHSVVLAEGSDATVFEPEPLID